MKPCLLVEDTLEDQKRLERFQESIEVTSIRIPDLHGYDRRGQYLIIPGVLLPQISKNAQENLLSKQVDLLIIPPFLTNDLETLLLIPKKVHLATGAFSMSKVVENDFLSKIGQDTLDIFFQKVVRAIPSKPLLVNSSGQPLLVCTQVRSTWGRLLITSLLLTSLSARSKEAHKKLFWEGLSLWLAATAPAPIQAHYTSTPKPPSEDIRLPLLLMAAQIARKGETLLDEDFIKAINQVQRTLHLGEVAININEASKLLMDQGILLLNGQGAWHIDLAKLSNEINRMHLASYIRRLICP